jgi:predicted HTH domain antitoxin
MKAFNIRQLKSNPSTVLQAAREDDLVVVMNRDKPQAVLVDLENLGLPDLPAVRLALAIALFKSGSISVGVAARMADKPLPEMLTLLASRGIPLTAGVVEADAAGQPPAKPRGRLAALLPHPEAVRGSDEDLDRVKAWDESEWADEWNRP